MAQQRFNQRDVKQAISTVNTTANALSSADTGTGFTIFPSDAIPPQIPSRTLVPDNAVGDGKAYPKQGKPYYFNPQIIPYSMALNSTMAQRILRMWQGGTIGNVTNTTPGTTDQTIQMKNPGDVPLVANIVRILGGESFLHGDCFVQSFEVTQSGSQEPRISAQFQNPGLFKKIADTSLVAANFVAMPAYYKYHGVKTSIIFTDGVNTFDFASTRRLCDVSVRGNQNVIIDQLPGDGFYDASNECYGAVSKEFNIDVQSADMTVKAYMDASFTEFASWLPNRKLTSVTLLFKTCEIIGSTTHNSEIEIKFPVGEFNLTGDTQGNNSAYTFNITAIEGDPTTDSLVIMRLRRVTTDLIV